jgi:catechol 2,3-dioxygenase-like lactoylglutathione lyase family enzyme
VKKTVNFDAPDVYHLYYGDERGSPGSAMTPARHEHLRQRLERALTPLENPRAGAVR